MTIEKDLYPFHVPVMLHEVLRLLNVKPGDTVVDVTLGGGGHAEAILKQTSPDGLLIGIDRDSNALNRAAERLSRFEGRVRFVNSRMGELSSVLIGAGVRQVNGVLADFGVSSFQLDTPERGFSFRQDAVLDMRMDRAKGETARDIIARLDEEELAGIIWKFGEERYSRRIARDIAGRSDIETTGGLARAVMNAVPAKARHGRIHPATRTFQALRIAVNDEMGEIGRFLNSAPEFLSEGGRMVVISYHSLEDRMVKRAFRKLAEGDDFMLPVRKALTPSEGEIAENPRARSAKLRVLERIK